MASVSVFALKARKRAMICQERKKCQGPAVIESFEVPS
jgi:hypothetical protein